MRSDAQQQYENNLAPRLNQAFRFQRTILAALFACLAGVSVSIDAAVTTPRVAAAKQAPVHTGDAFGVRVVGHHAYVAIGAGGVAVIDVRNPANCVRVGSYGARRQIHVEVIDVSNPTNCVRVGGYDTAGKAFGVAVAGNYAFVADSDACLQVIVLRDPTNCVRVGGYDTTGFAWRVAVVGNTPAWQMDRQVCRSSM